MPDARDEGAVLRPHRGPVGAVHLRVVEEVALEAPRLSRDLRPFRARVHPRLELGDVDRALANLRGPVGTDDAPVAAVLAGTRLVQQLLAIGRKRVRPDALDERRGPALLEHVSVDSACTEAGTGH